MSCRDFTEKKRFLGEMRSSREEEGGKQKVCTTDKDTIFSKEITNEEEQLINTNTEASCI
jgi:hypothetical protein